MDHIDTIIEASRDYRGTLIAEQLKLIWQRLAGAVGAPDEPVERRGRGRGALDAG